MLSEEGRSKGESYGVSLVIEEKRRCTESVWCGKRIRGGGKEEPTGMEDLTRAGGNQLRIPVRHCLEQPLGCLLYTHNAAGSLPCCLLDDGCKLLKINKTLEETLVYLQLLSEAFL